MKTAPPFPWEEAERPKNPLGTDQYYREASWSGCRKFLRLVFLEIGNIHRNCEVVWSKNSSSLMVSKEPASARGALVFVANGLETPRPLQPKSKGPPCMTELRRRFYSVNVLLACGSRIHNYAGSGSWTKGHHNAFLNWNQRTLLASPVALRGLQPVFFPLRRHSRGGDCSRAQLAIFIMQAWDWFEGVRSQIPKTPLYSSL